MSCNKCCGPGYASPQEAAHGPKEKVLFVTCPHASGNGNDLLVAIDVDEESETFCQILSKAVLPNIGDEVHHTGWNACSSCHDKPSAKRTHIILPCLNSNRIYFINVEDERNIRLEKKPPPALRIKGHRIEGGPQMLQLSSGGEMLRIDIDENGVMKLNGNFLFDFGAIEGGPYLGHEMRYPGGDCTSDIWV
ncbi:unnamed protein product [Cylicocyclus nassatus]|uniref:Selenium-binding protein n=1 Tax=Cylicocyclus nassatus TaxID=53992 RepID=A0AA36M6S5_CYLNA|nr:unnamed protein product [Cylicocyclus nassatus]